jgi:hypothetical protein
MRNNPAPLAVPCGRSDSFTLFVAVPHENEAGMPEKLRHSIEMLPKYYKRASIGV